MVLHENLEENEGEIQAWHQRLRSEFNEKLIDLDQLRRITSDIGEDPARVQAAYRLLDELRKEGEA